MSIYKPLSPTISPPKVTERSTSNLLPHFHLLSDNRKSMNLKPPRLISVSSMGLGQKGHQELPFMLKWFYGSFLKIPHDDKLEMERLIIGASGKGNEYIGLEKDENEQGWLEDFISEYHLMNSCLNNLDLSVCWIKLNRALAFLKKLMLIRTLSLFLSQSSDHLS